jgi:hypothetical protein
MLYRPKVQESRIYKATVFALAEIMDVGFIVFSPIVILLFGFGAPLPCSRSACSRSSPASRSLTTSTTTSR